MGRKIIINDDFREFYKSQNPKVRQKIKYVFDLVQYERRVPVKFFKYLTNTEGIYEIRVVTNFKSIRILCFFDKEELIVVTNFFTKKTQRTPSKEIRTAEKMKNTYLGENYGGRNTWQSL